MDLGFGASNQAAGDAAAKVLLQSAQVQEQVLEDEMAKYDSLLDDDDALELLRKRRIEEMKKKQQQQQNWTAIGHGTYTELGGGQDSRDVAKEFFQATKESERLVVHFYRPSTRYCDIFHAHLSKIASKHKETKFLKVNVEDCDHQGAGASFLVERLGIVIMPTLVLVKDRKAFHHIRGFDELGGTDDFSTNTLVYVLGGHGILDIQDDEEMPEEIASQQQAKNKGVNAVRIRKGAVRDGFRHDMDDFE